MEESHPPRSTFARRARVLVSILAATLAAAHAWAAEVFHFDIPAGNAEDTLPLIYPQSQFLILYKTDDVRGLRTKSVVGDFAPEEAIRRMLEGTGLAFVPGSNLVRPMETSDSGPPSEGHEHSGSAIALRGLPSLAREFVHMNSDELKEVVVTGTRIRGVLDIVSPLMFVRKDQIQRGGYGGLHDALQSLPMLFGGGPSEYFDPGGNFNRAASVNLRGLGPGATLVLINGRRQPFAGLDAEFVDISNIPWAAVDRIEVLPDGASASYGSDAVAGVVNIITREDFAGTETQARLGFTSRGAAETTVSQLLGSSWETGRLFFTYQYSDRKALAAADRSYTADSDKTALGGSNFSSVSSSPGNFLDPLTLQPLFAIPDGQDGRNLTVDQLLPDVVNYSNRFENYDVIPERRMHSGFLQGSQRLGSS